MFTLTHVVAWISLFFAGAWWEAERKAATYALIFAAIMLAIGGLS